MDQGHVPILMKQATITPIHKGGIVDLKPKTIAQCPLLPTSLRFLKE